MSQLITSSRFHANPQVINDSSGPEPEDHLNVLNILRDVTRVYVSSPQFVMGYRVGHLSFW